MLTWISFICSDNGNCSVNWQCGRLLFAFNIVDNICFTERFLLTVVSQLSDVSYSREKLTSFHFTDADITYVFYEGTMLFHCMKSFRFLSCFFIV